MEQIYHSYGFLFAKANEKIQELLRPALDELGITPKHMGLALIINDHPGITQKQAGDIQRIDRTSMTQLVDSMERLHILKRTPSPGDRRAYGLHLTEEGSLIVTKLWRAIEEAQSQYFHRLTADQINQLKEILLILMEDRI